MIIIVGPTNSELTITTAFLLDVKITWNLKGKQDIYLNDSMISGTNTLKGSG